MGIINFHIDTTATLANEILPFLPFRREIAKDVLDLLMDPFPGTSWVVAF